MTCKLPSSDVLAAFGLTGEPHPLAGGEAKCFRVEDAVLKLEEGNNESQEVSAIVATLLNKMPRQSAYRLARPFSVTEQPNIFTYGGWTASQHHSGKEGPKGRFEQILDISQALHRDLARVASAPPGFIEQRVNRWSEADRVTWDEKSLTQITGINQDILAHLATPLHELRQLKRELPIQPAQQLIHADMTGNVLFNTEGGGAGTAAAAVVAARGQQVDETLKQDEDEESVPTVIDMTLYWRPADYAGAVIVADGLTWFGEGRQLVEAYGTDEVRLQYLIRALYWRCLTFAIDHDPQWIRDTVPMEGLLGANRIVKEVMQDMGYVPHSA